MSKYRKGYVQAYKDLALILTVLGSYSFIFYKMLEKILF